MLVGRGADGSLVLRTMTHTPSVWGEAGEGHQKALKNSPLPDLTYVPPPKQSQPRKGRFSWLPHLSAWGPVQVGCGDPTPNWPAEQRGGEPGTAASSLYGLAEETGKGWRDLSQAAGQGRRPDAAP